MKAVERLARLRPRLRTLIASLKNHPFDDGAGLPPAEPSLERTGRGLAWLAGAFLFAVGLWEIDAPFGAGHYAAATAFFTAGENFWRFGTLAPLLHHPLGEPSNAEFYCHHPFGVFWTAGLFSLLGHHAWVCRLPAVLMSALTPALVYGAGRALFGPLAAGLSALAYAVLPITLAYANFFALEVPTMFGIALAIWGFARFSQSGRRRFAVSFVLGLAYAMAADWPGFVFAAGVLGWLFLRGFWLRRRFPPLPFERFATAWATAIVSGAALAAFHLLVFAKLDQLDDFIRQGEFRARGNDLPMAQALAKRAYWIALAFTPLGVVLGKLGAGVLAFRAFAERRDLEVLPLVLLGTALIQYLVFKQGADIHFFWPQYFALFFAYAIGALAATLERGVRFLLSRFARGISTARVAVSVLSLGILPLALILPDGLGALQYARKSGGRFNERGLIIHADFDKAAAFARFTENLPEAATLGVDASMKQSYWMDWVAERPLVAAEPPALARALATSHFVLDRRFSSGAVLSALARDFAVDAYGPFLFADLREAARPLDGLAVVPREPGFFERLLVSTNHALYDVEPNRFVTWDLRAHLGQEPNPPPRGEPRTLEELRIAHNLALAGGDTARASRLRARLFSGADRRSARALDASVAFLGLRYESGSSDLLTLYFEARAPLEYDAEFTVTSRVEVAPSLSLTPRDVLAWNVGMPFDLPTSLWRPGFVYASVSELVNRPGRERYTGHWRGARDKTAPAPSSIVLLTLD